MSSIKMKKLTNLFLLCFLVIATIGVGNLQANVIEKNVTYVNVGLVASIDIVSFDFVVSAIKTKVGFVYNNFTVIGCYAKAATVKSGKVEFPVSIYLIVYKVPWRFKQTNTYFVKTFRELQNRNLRNPRDGLVIKSII